MGTMKRKLEEVEETIRNLNQTVVQILVARNKNKSANDDLDDALIYLSEGLKEQIILAAQAVALTRNAPDAEATIEYRLRVLP